MWWVMIASTLQLSQQQQRCELWIQWWSESREENFLWMGTNERTTSLHLTTKLNCWTRKRDNLCAVHECATTYVFGGFWRSVDEVPPSCKQWATRANLLLESYQVVVSVNGCCYLPCTWIRATSWVCKVEYLRGCQCHSLCCWLRVPKSEGQDRPDSSS